MLRSRIRVSAQAKSREAKPRQWRAMLIRKPGQVLGNIDAPDMKAAEPAR
jgi:hypothetical protein